MRTEDPTFQDIERLQDQVRRIERELDHSQRLASLGMVLGIIAHEFNNILTPVMSYSQLALDNPSDADLTAKALRRAADGAEKAARIAASVLALARKDGYLGQGNSPVAASEVSHCFNEARQCLAMDHDKDGIEITGVPCGTVVEIEPVALQQVFVNLLLNARKSLRGKTGRITLRCSAGNSGKVVIELEDSGRGIASDVLGRIFDPFVTEASDDPTPGTGLGLTICRRLIESAGGTITATSVVGEGSCFRICLARAGRKTNQPVHK